MNRNQNNTMSDNKKRFNNLRQKHRLKIIRSNNNNHVINQHNGRPLKIVTAHKQQSSREALVKKNLQHLKESMAAKRTAQNHYYGQGKSPMLKNQAQSTSRASVQDRIGGIRNRQNQQQNRQQKVNLRQQKINRVNNFKTKKAFNKNNVNNPQKELKVMRTLDGKVKILRKLNSNNIRVKKAAKPDNYVINVTNMSPTKNLFDNYVPKFKMTTNPKIQHEINLLQNKVHSMPIVPVISSESTVINRALTDYWVPVATTTVSINDRFNTYKFVQ